MIDDVMINAIKSKLLFLKQDMKMAIMASVALLLCCAFFFVSCQNQGNDLAKYIEKVKALPPGKIEPIPTFKSYEPFAYTAGNDRDPFQISIDAAAPGGPDQHRNRELLESFSLDSLRVVGIVALDKQKWAIISVPSGAVHRVTVGNYMGQHYGRITSISDTGVNLIEKVPGDNGWMDRPALLQINAGRDQINIEARHEE